jgi:hypothetical protein
MKLTQNESKIFDLLKSDDLQNISLAVELSKSLKISCIKLLKKLEFNGYIELCDDLNNAENDEELLKIPNYDSYAGYLFYFKNDFINSFDQLNFVTKHSEYLYFQSLKLEYKNDKELKQLKKLITEHKLSFNAVRLLNFEYCEKDFFADFCNCLNTTNLIFLNCQASCSLFKNPYVKNLHFFESSREPGQIDKALLIKNCPNLWSITDEWRK